MDKPGEPTHGPIEPIHAPHYRSLEEAVRSLDLPTAC
jgi:hypothetical protein